QVDFRDVNTPDEFTREFYSQTKASVVGNFETKQLNIETAHSYFFWEQLLGWNTKETRALQCEERLSDDAFRHKFYLMKTGTLLPEIWCEAALRYLTHVKDEFVY